ncbi:MAG: radical SAM protein [Sedimentisphaerales bacterium]|nr:radical SAM protein [Sedimentisphaerales bacterium]
MKPRILLVNPPIYDFAAYDFWLKPYGLLRVGGRLTRHAELVLFDFMDRLVSDVPDPRSDSYGRGRFPEQRLAKPSSLRDIPRYWRRFGRNRDVFQTVLREQGPFDAVLIQTTLTYWYPGIVEVIENIRAICGSVPIVMGGVYATLCPDHAAGLGADLVIQANRTAALWDWFGIPEPPPAPPFWQGYDRLGCGVITLTKGCPFSCSYCASELLCGSFKTRPLEDCIRDLNQMIALGIQDIAFYDDALLYKPEQALIPFLHYVIDHKIHVRFHTPNALHGRFLSAELAQWMVRGGFKTFYLGYESRSEQWQQVTGDKVRTDEIAGAVEHLRSAGADPHNIVAYQIIGHPDSDIQQIEASMHFAHHLGMRIMLADFSPIPGTPDGDRCNTWIDMSEPLNHNKTAFPIRLFGADTVNRFKDLCRKMNASIG